MLRVSATPRVIYGWAQTGTFFKIFTRIDEKSGIPRPALWLTFALSVFWTLPFPSWEALIKVVSAALVLSYAVAPVSVAALRRNAPDMPRPFRVKFMGVLGPLSFIIAALIVYWSGWSTVSWLLGLQIAMFVVYLLCGRFGLCRGKAQLHAALLQAGQCFGHPVVYQRVKQPAARHIILAVDAHPFGHLPCRQKIGEHLLQRRAKVAAQLLQCGMYPKLLERFLH